MPAKVEKDIYGLVAEFANPDALVHAAEKVREAGYKVYDCHSPFPIHGMDEAMGETRSPIGYIVGGAALLAFFSFVAFLYWVTAVDYKFVISGKPYFSYQAFVPVIFAVCVLTSAIVATFGMIAINRLPQWFHPLFESKNFARVTDDGFFVSVAAVDPKFDISATSDFLTGIGGTNIEVIEVKPDSAEEEE
jgi:hypothetical protein